jgi:hypothetical protein
MKKIILLCGDLVEDECFEIYRSSYYNEVGDYSSMGGVARIRSSVELYRDCEYDQIIVTGGYGKLKGKIEKEVAKYYNDELQTAEKLRVDTVLEIDSNNTYEQLLNCLDLFTEKDAVSIITNTYHIGRVSAFITHMPELEKYNKGNVCICSAESILSHVNTALNYEIEMAYKSEAMKKRIEMEKKGIEAIKNGTYNFNKKEGLKLTEVNAVDYIDLHEKKQKEE